ncbi:hypothetical protein D3C79_889090 [compost metagenome]
MAQGFTHRGTADAEAVAEVALDQAVARQQLEAHDRPAQFVEDDFTQGDGVAVDLEAVVEGLAFHHRCSAEGCCGCTARRYRVGSESASAKASRASRKLSTAAGTPQ